MPLPCLVKTGAVGLAMRSGDTGLIAVGDVSLQAASASAATVGAMKRFIDGILDSAGPPVDAMGGWRRDGVRACRDASSSTRDAVHEPEPRPQRASGARSEGAILRPPSTTAQVLLTERTGRKKPAGPWGPAGSFHSGGGI